MEVFCVFVLHCSTDIYAPYVKIACTVCRPLIIRNVVQRVNLVTVSLF